MVKKDGFLKFLKLRGKSKRDRIEMVSRSFLHNQHSAQFFKTPNVCRYKVNVVPTTRPGVY